MIRYAKAVYPNWRQLEGKYKQFAEL